MKWIVGMIIVTSALVGYALEARELRWLPPTTRVGGGPLSIQELAGYLALCGESNKGPFANSQYFPGGATTSGEVPDTADYSYCVLRAVDTEGDWSSDSNVVGKPVAPGPAIFHWLQQ